MEFNRPDLSQVESSVRDYIEHLEAEIERLRSGTARPSKLKESEQESFADREAEYREPPTTINVISATASGIAKRTPRHHYSRQRRGGMGVFDLEAADQEPSILTTADESQNLLLLTNLARAFRLPVNAIPEMEVRDRGEPVVNKLNLMDNEHLAVILPEKAEGYLAMLSERGHVRLLRHHVFGDYMKPGTSVYDLKSYGPLSSACWTPGDGDLFIATRSGRGIRFSEKSVPPQGTLGIRLADDDTAVAITSVIEDSGVFLLGADGKGTIRLMSGFSANKAPGAGGKIAMTTDKLIAAAAAEPRDDIFIISRLSKIIRFQADEVPAKEGVVQGVVCMSLRADEPAAVTISSILNVL